jgi:hypothetical protein
MKLRERRATTALLLGLLGLFFGILAPFALVSGVRSLRDIQRARGRLTGEASALTGIIGGALGSAALVVGVSWWLWSASL